MRGSSWENQKKRKASVVVALRKRAKSKAIYRGHEFYDNLHQYSKNKIFCSCEMCRFRSPWNPEEKTMSDARKTDSMDYKLREYLIGA